MPQEGKKINVNTSTISGSVFAQLVGVTVGDSEVTLEFVYINQRDSTQGNVVSRVTLPIPVAEQLSVIIPETIKIHKAKKSSPKKNEVN